VNDFFIKNNAAVVEHANISHNDLIRNLQSKFKATNGPNDGPKKEGTGALATGTEGFDLNGVKDS